MVLAGIALPRLEDPLPRWHVSEAGKLCWLRLHGASPRGLMGFLKAWWLGSKGNVSRNRKERLQFPKGLVWKPGCLFHVLCIIHATATKARFKRKGHKPYFLVGGEVVSEIWGPCFKPQEERNVLSSHRPSPRFRVHPLAVFYGQVKKEMSIKLNRLNTVIVNKCPFYILAL